MISNCCKNTVRGIATSAKPKPVSSKNIRSFEEIPGPKPLPVIGNLWRYLPVIGEYSFDKIHQSYEKMYDQYGPLVREKIFGDRTLLHVFDPIDMRIAYDAAGYKPVRSSHHALARYRMERPHLYSGSGLFPSNGDEWYRFRSLFQSLLLNPTSTEGCSSVLENVTNDLIDYIPSLLDDRKEVDLQPLLFNWALECIGVITLNRRLGCLSDNGNKRASSLVKAANDTHEAVARTENRPFSYLSYKKLEAAQNLFSEVVEEYLTEAIEDAEYGRNAGSLVNQMLQIKNADKKDVFTMILDLIMAGIDTTAYTLAFGLYNLAMNERVQNKLAEEMKVILPTKDSRLTGTSEKQFPYLSAFIKETLRVNPVAIGNGRVIQKDIVLRDFHVPAQTLVVFQHQVASLQEQYFSNPLQFEPERWIRREFTGLVSSPFGFGFRLCIGKTLAYKELQLGFAKIVRHFDMTYHHEKIGSINRLINVPDKPLRLRLKERNE